MHSGWWVLSRETIGLLDLRHNLFSCGIFFCLIPKCNIVFFCLYTLKKLKRDSVKIECTLLTSNKLIVIQLIQILHLDIEEEKEDKDKETGSGCEYQGLCGCPAGFYPMVVYGQIQCIGKPFFIFRYKFLLKKNLV